VHKPYGSANKELTEFNEFCAILCNVHAMSKMKEIGEDCMIRKVSVMAHWLSVGVQNLAHISDAMKEQSLCLKKQPTKEQQTNI